jgi:hypothetical protein
MSVIHLDKLGKEITVGDCVAVPVRNHMRVGRVTKLTSKMVRIDELTTATWQRQWIKYSDDLVVVDGPGVTMLVLKVGK